MKWDKSGALAWIGWTVLAVAGCSEPEKSALERLAERGYAFHMADFQRAAVAGEREVVELFVASGMAVDARDASGSTALLAAVQAGHSGVAHRLVELGADPDVIDGEGRTPLLHAACSGDAALVESLLLAGADPGTRDREGWSALTGAAMQGHSDAVALLAGLEGAEVDKALHLACVGGDVATVGALLKAGGSVYTRSGEERTALMYAAANGNLSVVKLLLRNGANRYAIDAGTRTAAQLARANAFSEVAELLEEPPVDLEVDPHYLDFVLADEGDDVQAEAAPGDAAEVAENGLLDDLEERLAEAERAARENSPGAGAADAGELQPVFELPLPEAPEDLEAVYARATLAAAGDAAGPVVPGGMGARGGGRRDREADRLKAEIAVGNARLAFIRAAGGGGTRPNSREAGHRDSAAGRESKGTRSIDGLVLRNSLAFQAAGASVRSAGGGNHATQVMRMHGYRESQLPVMLVGVSRRGGAPKGLVRLLYGDGQRPFEVGVGEMIADSGLRVVELQRRLAQTKRNSGMSVDVSRMVVEDPESGERNLLIRGLPAMSSRVHAVVSLGDESKTLYEARMDDRFTAAGGGESYRVLDVRPKQLVILRENSAETFTVAKTVR